MTCTTCSTGSIGSSIVAPARTNQNMTGTHRTGADSVKTVSRLEGEADYISRESSDTVEKPKRPTGQLIDKRFENGSSVMDRLGDIAETAVSSVSGAFLSENKGDTIEGDWEAVLANVAKNGGTAKDSIEDQTALESLIKHGFVMESYAPLLGSSVYLTREGSDFITQNAEDPEATLESIIEDLTGRTPTRRKEKENNAKKSTT